MLLRRDLPVMKSPVCGICGNDTIVRFPSVKDTSTGDSFSIFECISCGVGQTFPRPDDLSAYYDNTYYGNRHGKTGGYCVKRRMKIVSSAVERTAGKRLLDIGCGDGSFMRAMMESGWTAAGTERNPDSESTKGLAVEEDIKAFSNAHPFDCVTMWHTLEHMHDIDAMLGQIHDMLAPGGKLIIAVPNNAGFQARLFKKQWLHLDVPRHLFHFDVESLNTCLIRNNFSVQHQGYQEIEYDLLGWTQSALNLIFDVPNVFFDCLRGKQSVGDNPFNLLNAILGGIFLSVSLPAVLVERVFNCSGTIITTAVKAKT